MLNYIKLQPGEAFSMDPDEPHAYIEGDCIEAMALSDNVVRLGLTPKFKDSEVLIEMLTYNLDKGPSYVKPAKFTPPLTSFTHLKFAPGYDEFSVNQFKEVPVIEGKVRKMPMN